MTFLADPVKHRTYDQLRGLELFVDGSGPDGSVRYRLVRSDGFVVRFTTRQDRSRTEERQLGGSTTDVIVHRVTSERERFRSRSRNLTDIIIREALIAYKGNHGLPPDSAVVVHFDTR